MAWTDVRLDDLSRRMDQGFERVLVRIGGGMLIGLFGVIAAILARGV